MTLHSCNFPPETKMTRAIVSEDKLWSRRVLFVKFISQTADVIKNKIQSAVKQWELCTSLTFIFDEKGSLPGDIRINTDLSGSSWSYIGTDAMNVPVEKQTMNLGWLTEDLDDNRFNAVVLHEFGHAIGFQHEQLHPNLKIDWDKEKVYKYYSRFGWTKEDVDLNLFSKMSWDKLTGSKVPDAKSIMMYPIPSEWTHDTFHSDFNFELTRKDRNAAYRAYPIIRKKKGETATVIADVGLFTTPKGYQLEIVPKMSDAVVIGNAPVFYNGIAWRKVQFAEKVGYVQEKTGNLTFTLS